MNMPHYIKHPVSISLQLAFTLLIVISIGCSSQDSVNSNKNELDLQKQYQHAIADLANFKKELASEKLLANQSTRNAEITLSEEQREKVAELQQDLEESLDKLIALNPNNEEYRFELARMAAAKGDQAKAIEILKALAPEDVPGHPPAHFLLAKSIFAKQAASSPERQTNLDVVLKHLEHILSRNEDDRQANHLKAQTLTMVQRFDEAYEVYERLLKFNPNYYREMAQLNKWLKLEERNPPLFEQALGRFLAVSEREPQLDDKRWIVTETGITKTLQSLDRFQEAETRLLEMINRYGADPQGGARRVFLQRLLADTYISWSGKVANPNGSYESLPDASLKELVYFNEKAYRIQPQNTAVLQSLTLLSFSSNSEIAAKAKAIYDPVNDMNAPGAVLNQLGNHMLINKKFSEAIQFYNRAREKSPRDAAILNNLAYSYLVAEDGDRNAERALQLIDEAIRYLPANVPDIEKSKFLHTRATALMQMDRLQEAIEAFEESLKSRPNHADTLRSLIESYRTLNIQPPDQYISRLQQIPSQK